VSPQAEDLRILVCLLREFRHCTEKEMAAATRLHPGTIRRYESGFRIPRSQNLETIAKAAGVPMSAVDGLLLPVIAAVRGLIASGEALLPGDTDRLMATALHEQQAAAAAAAVAEFMAEQDLADGEGVDSSAVPLNGLAISETGSSTQPLTTEDLKADAELYLEFERLSIQLCDASVRGAADDAAEALLLAQRALCVAELAPGDPRFRLRLQGNAWGFISNAQRVGSDIPAADRSFITTWRLWRAGAAAPGSVLAEWRLLDLEASLRRGQRQFSLALSLLDRALRAAPAEAQGKILLNKAFALEQAGETEAALAVLGEAAPLVDPAREPRLQFGVLFNGVVLLCHLGRYDKGQRQLADLKKLADDLGNQLDILRVRWLSGRVAAGMGRRKEARTTFTEVQRELADRGSAYDAALVSLELTILALEEGRRTEVHRLAEEMLWVFGSRGVHREALAALSLFRQAVESQTASVDLAYSVLAFLERARHDTQLAFKAPACSSQPV
jgi:transcriptional regulator with XRE-family HTH domain